MALKVPYYVMFALTAFNHQGLTSSLTDTVQEVNPFVMSHSAITSSQVSGNRCCVFVPSETYGMFGKVSVWAGRKTGILQEAVNKRFNML